MKKQNFKSTLTIEYNIDAIVYLPCYNSTNIRAVIIDKAVIVDDPWVLTDDINGIQEKPFSVLNILYFADIKKDKEAKRLFEKTFVVAQPKQEVCAMVYLENKERKVYYVAGDVEELQKKIEDLKENIRNLKHFSKFSELEKELKEEFKKINQDI